MESGVSSLDKDSKDILLLLPVYGFFGCFRELLNFGVNFFVFTEICFYWTCWVLDEIFLGLSVMVHGFNLLDFCTDEPLIGKDSSGTSILSSFSSIVVYVQQLIIVLWYASCLSSKFNTSQNTSFNPKHHQ